MKAMTQNQQSLYNRYSSQIAILHQKWYRVFRPLYVEQHSIEVLNRAAQGTFYFILFALLDDVILTLTRLTENRDKASVQRLISEFHEEGELELKLQSDFSNLKKACKPLKDRRDNWIAHRNRTYELSTSSPVDIGVSRRQVEAALYQLRTLFNDIELYFLDVPVAYEATPLAGNGYRLVQLLDKALQQPSQVV